MYNVDDDLDRLQLELRQLQALRTEVLMKTQRLLQTMDMLSDEIESRLNNLSDCTAPTPPAPRPQAHDSGTRPN